ncbi:argonaute-like protein [Collybia nuda]|uniref:Argonaute-like protein n=1 Tax=Collybia nuda TaxID=64659 RepID=A0A9P5YFD8_9AGAR|nr:argonaute-like protein [Collybia nuda]
MSTRNNPRSRGRGGNEHRGKSGGGGPFIGGGRGAQRGQSRGPGHGSSSERPGTGHGSPAFHDTGRGRGRGEFDPRGRSGPQGNREFRGGFRRRNVSEGPTIFSEDTPAQIPSRLTDVSHNDLLVPFKALKVSPGRPLRPGYGTAGTAITLRSNFFPVWLPKGPIYDYTIEISPKVSKKESKLRLFQLLEQSPLCTPYLSHIAHDRSQRLVSAQKLPQPLVIQVPYFEEEDAAPSPDADVYTISIKFERELDIACLTQYLDGLTEARDYDTLPLVSALNLVLQQHASRNGFRVGINKYFFPSLNKFDIGFGVQVWQGFYASVRPTYKQLMVNVNACFTAFVEPGNLADALLAFGRNSKGALPNLPEALVRSLKVRTQHLHHTKLVKAIGNKSARQTTFNCEELGGKVTVEQYFLKKYNKKLEYPTDLPVVDLGGPKKNVWVPAELCDIKPGQPYTEKLNFSEAKKMIERACNPPKHNAEAIVNEDLHTLDLAPVGYPIDGFGVSIDTAMAVVPGRKLDPPFPTYKTSKAKIKDGSWNIMGATFHKGIRVDSWWVMVVQDGQGTITGREDPQYVKLETGFTEKCRNSGIYMPRERPRFVQVKLPRPSNSDPGRGTAIDTISNEFQSSLSAASQKPDFILVMLEARDKFIYPGIKRLGDVKFGIHTIHMQLPTALKIQRQDQYFSNIALKLNAKLGGINHVLNEQAMKWLTKEKTMMVGIDVTHPGPGTRDGTPSIAAVVANIDDDFVQFPASLRIQWGKKEARPASLFISPMLDELRDMMLERLLLYEKKNKVLPQRILVFRDGVSEGQFNIVLREELDQILDGFKKLSTKGRKGKYRPVLSIIICGFYPTDSANATKNGNTMPGTVVDKGVTAVFDFDFYLQAHAGIQGTVKPTHYTVVYDESNLTADEIQQGAHNTSYLYARATKAVSLIPAAYYADLACERGRCYLNDFLMSSKSKGGKRDPEEEKRVFNAAKQAWGEGLHANIRESMFYI